MSQRYFNEVEQGEEYQELLMLDDEYEKWLDMMNENWWQEQEEYYESGRTSKTV